MNDRLRSTMTAKHVDVARIAQETEVDPKTVQRWVNGRMPHARHRWALAKLLGEREDYLWPENDRATEQAISQAPEIIAAYTHRTDTPGSLWWQLFTKAHEHIDMLGFAMLFLPEQHAGLMDLLREKANNGCDIRIAVADPRDHHVQERDDEESLDGTLAARIQSTIRHFRVLQNVPNVSIGLHRTAMYNSVFRFDDEMFVTPHLYGLHGSKAPLMHLRKLSGSGLFANFQSHFDNIWNITTPLAETPYGKASGGK